MNLSVYMSQNYSQFFFFFGCCCFFLFVCLFLFFVFCFFFLLLLLLLLFCYCFFLRGSTLGCGEDNGNFCGVIDHPTIFYTGMGAAKMFSVFDTQTFSCISDKYLYFQTNNYFSQIQERLGYQTAKQHFNWDHSYIKIWWGHKWSYTVILVAK